MICSSNFCFSTESQNELLSLPLKQLLIKDTNKASYIDSAKDDLGMVQYSKPNCYTPKASLKSHYRESASNSTLSNTEVALRLQQKKTSKKAHFKISISQLKKNRDSKFTANLSLTSSVRELSIDSKENSIIDKLETLRIEGKLKPIQKSNNSNFNLPEILLPQPRLFMPKGVQNIRLQFKHMLQ